MFNKLIYSILIVLVLVMSGGRIEAKPFAQDAGPDGIVSMEAENFDNNIPQGNHTWELITDTAGFSGTGALRSMPDGGTNNNTGYITDSPRLDYEVNFAKKGTHYVWVRSYRTGGNDDSLHAGLDGQENTTANRIQCAGPDNSWNWSNGTMDAPRRATIEVPSAGVQTFNIWMREDGSRIDKILLTTNPDYVPTGTGPIESSRGPRVKAHSPNPEDGAMVNNTWASLSWLPGDFAVSHDIYFSDNFEDVNAGVEAALRANQPTTEFLVGFPGYPFPDGLVPGTTYYWRIDEVDEANAASPWAGDVWSFWIPPKTAYNPVPADGAKFIDSKPTLTWTPGFGAKLHTVYFGENYDDVSNAAGGPLLGMASYTPPGTLQAGKTYYWRVDEFDPPLTYKGDIWSFQIAKDGGGVKGQYFKGMNFENLVLTRTDPKIDFTWGNNAPDPVVGEDNFSCRWTGQVEAAFTETYTFYTNSDDGVRLWVDGKRLINNWTDHGTTEDKGKIDLVAGNKYSIVMEMYENGGGAVAQLSWSSPRTPKQIIPAAALSFLVNAYSPKPADGTVGVKLVSALTWKPGEFASSHDVYFGTDADAVLNATKASPEYKGNKKLGSESLDPGKLAIDTTYYWRVDEVNNVNPGSPWAGNIWSFNTGDFLVVDDFESYNDIDPPAAGSNRIFDIWIDGFGTTTNGALVGNDLPPYAEQTVVHGGSQSMIYRYDNAGKTSEATMTLAYPRNWTEEGVTKLSLWFRGNSGNSAEKMYVALNGNAVVYNEDSAATQKAAWTQWVIDLQAFAGQGVNLTSVNTLTIGFGTKNAPAAGGTGKMYFDDIRLYR